MLAALSLLGLLDCCSLLLGTKNNKEGALD